MLEAKLSDPTLSPNLEAPGRFYPSLRLVCKLEGGARTFPAGASAGGAAAWLVQIDQAIHV
ncbi:MAG: hypothetical protein SFV15_02765 [Polyangiaceae bacterium]|nr:hypothetical protein [Polyangiaceae bacterium]